MRCTVDSLAWFSCGLTLKSPTAEIVFLDFRQIEAVFGKTNYTTFVHLVMPIYRQNMSEIKILTLAVD